MSRPTIVKFYLEHNDDDELTCFICRRSKCELSFTVFGDGSTTVIGVHAECVERHDARERKRLDREKAEG